MNPEGASRHLLATVESSDDSAPAGVWVFMGLYVVFLIGVAGWSWWEGRQIARSDSTKGLNRSDSKIEEHYVASRDLGPWALALTLLASTWSGYTVVGAPQDTYRRGWNATRYMGGFVITQSCMLLVCARMQWYAFKRNYVSTVDFITDRFRSHFTRVFVSIAQLFSTVLYVMGQFKSIGATVEGMSNEAIPAIAASIVMCVIMLGYEWFGGMRAIALTDLVQGLILIVGCCLYFIAMETVFDGGIDKTTTDLRRCATLWDTYPADELVQCADDGSQCKLGDVVDSEWGHKWFVKKDCELSGYPDGSSEDYGAKDAKDLLTIDDDDVKAWLPFYVAGISFPIYPQILVRFYTARNVRHLQYGMQLTHLSVFYLCLPAFLTGYTILSRNLPGLYPGESRDGGGTTGQAFAKIMNATIEYNWFFYITGCLTVSAAIAAYMSTADSALMAASSMVTLDFTRDYLLDKPQSEQEKETRENRLYIVAKLTSVFFGGFAVLMTLWDIPLTDLYIIQGTILMLGCPAYFLGMYNKTVNTFAVNIGLCVGTLVFIILQWGTKTELPEVWSTIANIAVTLIVSYSPLSAMWYGTDKIWDPAMVPDFLTMKTPLDIRVVGYDISKYGPKYEPIRPWWINFIVFLLLFIAIPFWQNIPSSYEEESFSGAMPTWAVVSTFFAAIAMMINMFQTYYNWSDWIGEDPENKDVLDLPPPEEGEEDYGTTPKAIGKQIELGNAGSPTTTTVDSVSPKKNEEDL